MGDTDSASSSQLLTASAPELQQLPVFFVPGFKVMLPVQVIFFSSQLPDYACTALSDMCFSVSAV